MNTQQNLDALTDEQVADLLAKRSPESRKAIAKIAKPKSQARDKQEDKRKRERIAHSHLQSLARSLSHEDFAEALKTICEAENPLSESEKSSIADQLAGTISELQRVHNAILGKHERPGTSGKDSRVKFNTVQKGMAKCGLIRYGRGTVPKKLREALEAQRLTKDVVELNWNIGMRYPIGEGVHTLVIDRKKALAGKLGEHAKAICEAVGEKSKHDFTEEGGYELAFRCNKWGKIYELSGSKKQYGFAFVTKDSIVTEEWTDETRL